MIGLLNYTVGHFWCYVFTYTGGTRRKWSPWSIWQPRAKGQAHILIRHCIKKNDFVRVIYLQYIVICLLTLLLWMCNRATQETPDLKETQNTITTIWWVMELTLDQTQRHVKCTVLFVVRYSIYHEDCVTLFLK